MTATELLAEYAEGKRAFSSANLRDAVGLGEHHHGVAPVRVGLRYSGAARRVRPKGATSAPPSDRLERSGQVAHADARGAE